jgi:hypothetical protein
MRKTKQQDQWLDVEILRDLGLIDEEGEEQDECILPDHEPTEPSIDSPPGEWTEYSDFPPVSRLIRLPRDKYTPEAAWAELTRRRGAARQYGEVIVTSRFFCLRVTDG